MNVSASEFEKSQIVWNCYVFETKNWSYLAVPDDDWLNQLKNETYNLQFTNNKMMMKITINTDCINMYRSINMWNSKLWYWYKQNKLAYLIHDNDFFNNK